MGDDVGIADANRRNGKPASCEPCRKAKVRCDHIRPICGRCQRRRISARCFYHPAPLTRRLSSDEPVSRRESSTQPTELASSATTIIPRNTASASTKLVSSVRKLVAHLEHIARIDELVQRYYAISPNSLIPAMFVLPVSADLRKRWEATRDHDALVEDISRSIIASMSVELEPDTSTTPTAFAKLHYDQNLRIEMLGVIFNLAGSATLFDVIQGQDDKAAFLKTMAYCSDKALRLAHLHVPQKSDALIWLATVNLVLNTQITGDASPISWRCLGELTTDVLALKMHRETSYDSLPFFLAQLRRRGLGICYHIDKFIAGILGQPPRLSRRYINAQMPLDLSDEEILSEPPMSFEQLQLTTDGWCSLDRNTTATRARIRFMLGVFREEVMEFEHSAADNVQELKALTQRCQSQWRTVPAHLLYAPNIWNSGATTSRSVLLTTSHLIYREIEFDIYRMLEKHDSSFTPSVLETANDIMRTLLELGAARPRASYLSYDFAYLVTAHGISPAMRLASALAATCQSGSTSLPQGMSRGALIRSLSVFVAGLESLHDLNDIDKATITAAIKGISQALDEVLSSDEQPQSGRTAASKTTDATLSNAGSTDLTMNSAAYNADLINSVSFTPDGLTWAGDLDWMNLSSDWVKF